MALTVIATAGLFGSPVSWSHHRVWCVPAFLALVFRARVLGSRSARSSC
ncbi:hypothetical protein [Lentzea albidocapillata]|nr:hypothetical protein [Lentzea albidocapillata]